MAARLDLRRWGRLGQARPRDFKLSTLTPWLPGRTSPTPLADTKSLPVRLLPVAFRCNCNCVSAVAIAIASGQVRGRAARARIPGEICARSVADATFCPSQPSTLAAAAELARLARYQFNKRGKSKKATRRSRAGVINDHGLRPCVLQGSCHVLDCHVLTTT